MRNIIITGGELFNKGAQAMTFIAINECKIRFPDHQVFVLSELDLQRPKEEKEQYNFSFTGWYPIKFAKCQRNYILRAIEYVRNQEELLEAERLYKNTDLMIDISGYALGSNWSPSTVNRYLDHIEFAQMFNIPIYLMPQSFGPFDFDSNTYQRVRKLLKIPKVICAREKEGYLGLKTQFGLNNLSLKSDLVLNNRGIDSNNVFNVVPKLDLPNIRGRSVCIVPNVRLEDITNKNTLIHLYDEIIQYLDKHKYNIYLMAHSSQDLSFCKNIMSYSKHDSLIFLEKEYNCIEFNEIVRSFDFIIASRFHSIVHAFKNGIPCISIGWAVKYKELMNQFGQSKYVFDINDALNIKDILSRVDEMSQNRDHESRKILNILPEIQKENVFDIVRIE